MRTLHTAYGVGDLERSVDFYERLGFQEIGRVAIGTESTLLMLNAPGDGEVVRLELVHNRGVGSYELGSGFSHIVVQVDDLDSTLADLAQKGIGFDEPQHPAGENGPKTSWVRDPDGYRIELVERPPGHPDGITRADFE
jgi:lactoylglutathione lyase